MPFVDMSAGAFYEPILVSDFVTNYLRRDLTRPLSYQDRIKVKRTLKGLRVELNHTERVKHYKLSGMSTVPAQQLM
ncbi:argonaute 5 [Olea europaea subsp. europaea]|uniref:Argonaute 5 n=1 Tax=Olea europaea subsp. europaea TaxID=158383 RepID=A0A8S0P9M4_OLEEU|nr:argonaute 5 [Olea europaea subsp. europaea]